MTKKKIYLDYAATSFPKPEKVYSALDRFARQIGVGNDRGLYREAREVSKIIGKARSGIADLIGASRDEIIFTSGATAALNTFLLGYLKPGDHVITSPFEHNAVRRPLKFLQEHRQVEITTLQGSLQNGIDPEEVKKEITPRTRACVITHISNAFGLILPAREIGEILQGYPEIVFALDAAQSIGSLPLKVDDLGVDFLAFPGHKSLLGPPGIGGFYLRSELIPQLTPLIFGGTGIHSGAGAYLEEVPYKYEVGTQNSWGLAGLAEGVEYLSQRSVSDIHNHILSLTTRAIAGIKEIPGINLYLPGTKEPHGLVSFTLDKITPPDLASLLDELFSIKVREGLHCSPNAHQMVGTWPQGTVRASFGAFTEKHEVDSLIEALTQIAADLNLIKNKPKES